ncbi:MAG: sulfatase/phosphatase domain-containing protein, partial [Bacteroidota bacterium]
LLEWAGIPTPQQMQGLSFASYIDTPKRLREATYYHYFEYPGEHSVKRHYGIRTENYKLIHYYFDIDQWELFDLKKDPQEMNSVYNKPEYKSIQSDLLIKLNKMRQEYRDTSDVILPTYLIIPNKALDVDYELTKAPSPKYCGKGTHPLTDGKIENPDFKLSVLNDNWIGFEKDNMELSLPVNASENIKEIEIRFLDMPDSWVFPPDSVLFYGSAEDNNYKPMLNQTITKEKRLTGGYIVHYLMPFSSKNIRKIKIKAINHGVCPSGHPGEGKPAWIFSDELILR